MTRWSQASPKILYQLAESLKPFEVDAGNARGTAILFGPYGMELQNLMLRFIAEKDSRLGLISAHEGF